MHRQHGSFDPELTHKLHLTAELRVSFESARHPQSIPTACRLVAQMWAKGVQPPAMHNSPTEVVREELLVAVAAGKLALTEHEDQKVQRARDRVAEMNPPRKAGTTPRRLRQATDDAGKLAMTEVVGERTRELERQVDALATAYRDRGGPIEEAWRATPLHLEIARRRAKSPKA